MFRLSHRTTLFFVLMVLALVLAGCNATASTGPNVAQVPAGRAFAEGKEIYFSHTEASDPDIANTLTDMMKSPVLHVPALAQVPQEALADVYVFENGVSGSGPLGFQPDVFDNPPGSAGYSPLRQIILVKWADGAQARELTAEAEIEQALASGELTAQETGVVVNMPFMVWDGGKR